MPMSRARVAKQCFLALVTRTRNSLRVYRVYYSHLNGRFKGQLPKWRKSNDTRVTRIIF